MQGWGALPGYLGDQGVAPPAQEDPKQVQSDIHAIKQKYVGEGGFDGSAVEDILTFNLTPGAAVKYDVPPAIINAFIVNCSAGTAKVWLGDFTDKVGAQEHITVPSGGAAVQYCVATKGNRIITVGCDPAATANAVGCLIVNRL